MDLEELDTAARQSLTVGLIGATAGAVCFIASFTLELLQPAPSFSTLVTGVLGLLAAVAWAVREAGVYRSGQAYRGWLATEIDRNERLMAELERLRRLQPGGPL